MLNQKGLWDIENILVAIEISKILVGNENYRDALEWSEKFKDRIKPIIEECYESVTSGNEAKRAIELNTREDYRNKLNSKLNDIQNSELWRISKIIRNMRI